MIATLRPGICTAVLAGAVATGFLAAPQIAQAEAIDAVRVPALAARWSADSNLQLDWTLSGADSVNIYLLQSSAEDGEDEVVGTIAAGIENTGHFQWFIDELPEEVDVGEDQKICISVGDCDDAPAIFSDVFGLQDHADPETFRGNRQSYNLEDRAYVYAPNAGEIVSRNEDGKVILRWHDVDHWLLDRIRVELWKLGSTTSISGRAMMNTGFKEIEIDADECTEVAEPCYLRINSTRHSDRIITSGYFTVGDVDEMATPDCGDNPDEDTKYLALGEELDVGWIVGDQDPGQDLRVELYKADRHYLTIIERQLSSAGNRLASPWVIPYSVAEGNDYRLRVSSRSNGAVFGFSNTFSIESDREDTVTMAITAPVSGDEWRREGGARTRVDIEWEDSALADPLSRPDHVKIALYKNDRRFKTIFNQSTLDDGEKIPALSKQVPPETHTWVMPQTVPSGDDYSVRVMSYGDEDGFESDFDHSDLFGIFNFEVDEVSDREITASEDVDCPVFVELLCLEDSADCPVTEDQDEEYSVSESVAYEEALDDSSDSDPDTGEAGGSDNESEGDADSGETTGSDNAADSSEEDASATLPSGGSSGQSESQAENQPQTESSAPQNCFHRIYYIFSDGRLDKTFCL